MLAIVPRRWIVGAGSLFFAIIAFSLLSPSLVVAQGPVTPTPSPTDTGSSETPTPSDTPGATSTPSDTPGPTDTPTDTPTPTTQATESPTATPTPTASDTPSPSPTPSPTATATAAPTATATPAGKVSKGDPHLSSVLNDLVDSYASGGASAAGQTAQANGVSLAKNNQNVQVVGKLAHGSSARDGREAAVASDGVIEATYGDLVQISLPLSNLPGLAASNVFEGIRLPLIPDVESTGMGTIIDEGINTTAAASWQNAGITGQGVKVAILDLGFTGYSTLLGNELPPASRVHTMSFRADGKLEADTHGTQVAQIVADMAPGVEMWLVNFQTDVEYGEAMNYLANQHVQVINASFGWTNATPGDGAGYLQDSVTHITGAGELYVSSAANSAQGHMQQAYSAFTTTVPAVSSSSGEYHKWPSGQVYNEITNWSNCAASCKVTVSLAWNDWTDRTTPGIDFDLYLVRSLDGGATWQVVGASTSAQPQGFPWPTEYLTATVPAGGKLAVVVNNCSATTGCQDPLVTVPSPPAGGWNLNLFVSTDKFSPTLTSQTANRSLGQPADSPNAFTVGAVWWSNNTLEPYSSQGRINASGMNVPTGSEAIKPDIVGPDCTSTSLYPVNTTGGFCGTSGAAPHVAGAAALVRQAFPDYTNDQVVDLLECRASGQPSAVAGCTPSGSQSSSLGWGRLNLGNVPTGFAGCAAGSATCLGSGGWPAFQNTAGRQGFSPTSSVPTDSTVVWGTTLGSSVRSPVISPTNPDFSYSEGLSYAIAGRYVNALNPADGQMVWTFDLGLSGAASGQEAPAVTDYDNNSTGGNASDDSMYLYVGSADGYVYKLNAINGSQVCKSAKLGTNFSKASPTIGADGTVYFTDAASPQKLVAVKPDCSQKWMAVLVSGTGTSSPVYWDNNTPGDISDDSIFVGAGSYTYQFNTWGSLSWSYYWGSSVTTPSTLLLIKPGGSAKVYFVGGNGSLYSVVPNGATATAYLAPSGTHLSGSAAAFEYNTGSHYFYVYWGHLGVLYRFNTADSSTTSLALGGSLADATPVVDSAGNVFVGSTNGMVYGVNGATMSLLSGWPKTAGISTAAGLAISPADNSLFVPSSDGTLRKFNSAPAACPSCVADPDADWPLFQQDVARTGDNANIIGASPSLLWQRSPGGAAFPPVVGDTNNTGHSQGITYFVSGGNLRAIDLDTRVLLWSYYLGSSGAPAGFAAPAIVDQNSEISGHPNGIVYVGSKDGYLHAVDALTGALVWKTKVGPDISKTSPVIGEDGTVYVVQYASSSLSNLAALSPLGAPLWNRPIGAGLGPSGPAYDSTNHQIYVGGNNLYCFDAAGATCAGWPSTGYTVGTSAKAGSTPLYNGNNNSVYVLNNLGDLYSVSLTSLPTPPSATLELAHPFTGTGMGQLAWDKWCASDGCFYWALGGKLIRYDYFNKTTWVIPLLGTVANPASPAATTTNSTPVVDDNNTGGHGHVYIGTAGSNTLYVVSQNGSVANAVFTATSSLANAGAITHNPAGGIVLWPSATGGLYALGTPEGDCATCSLNDTYWPAFQGNAAHAPDVQAGGGPSIRETRTVTISASSMRPPLVDAANDRLYFVSGQYLYARKLSDGTLAWVSGSVEKKYYLGTSVTSSVYGMPALGLDTSRPGSDQTIIYVGGSDGNLHAVDALTGNGLWKIDVGNNISKASLAVTDHGYIAAVEDNSSPANDRLIVLDSKGSIVWAQPIGISNGTSSPAIDNNGTPGDPSDDRVIVGGGSGLYAFKLTDGTPISGFPASTGLINGAPLVAYISAIAVRDGYYVITAAGNLLRVDDTGSVTTLATNDVAAVGKSAAPAAFSFCYTGSPCTAANEYDTRIIFGLGNKLYTYTFSLGSDTTYADPVPEALSNLDSVTLGGELGDSSPLLGSGGGSTLSAYIGSTDQKFYDIDNLDTEPAVVGYVSPLTGGSMAGAGAFVDSDTLVWAGQNGKIHFYQDASGDASAPNSATGQWPLLQNDSQNTGVSSAALPSVSTDAVEQWAVSAAGAVKNPVIGDADQPRGDGTYPDGVAYYAAGHFLYALDIKTHMVVKQWDLGSSSGITGYESPAVVHLDPNATAGDYTDDENRVIIADKNGVVSAYGSNTAGNWVTSRFWSVDVGADASTASPLAGRNNFVYVVEKSSPLRLHAIKITTGGIAWSTPLGTGTGKSSPAFYDNGTGGYVIVGADKLYWVNALTGVVDGSKTCSFTGTGVTTPMVVDPDGTPHNGDEKVYVVVSNGTSNTQLYSAPAAGCSGPPTAVGSPITGGTGTIAPASIVYSSPDYYVFFAVGNKVYRYDTASATTNITLGSLTTNFTNSTPLVDNSKQVFIGGTDGHLYGINGAAMTALTPAYSSVDGNGWPKTIGVGTTLSSVAGALAMDSNGYLYVPALDLSLRRIGPAEPTACADCQLYDAAPWPMFQHDVQHTGHNMNGAGHRTPVVDWSRTTVSPLSSPRTQVLGPGTNAYPNGVLFGTSGQKVVARDASNGNIIWQYDLGSTGTPSGGAAPALLRQADGGADGCVDQSSCSNDTVWVVVGAKDGFLYALDAYSSNPNGSLVWRTDLGLDISKSSPVIGSDGTIYITEDASVDRLHAIYWNGTQRWVQNLGSGSGASSPVLDVADNRVFVGSANKIYGFTTSGAAVSGWPIQVGTSGTVNTSPMLDENDNLWIVNSSGYLYRLDPSAGAQTAQLVFPSPGTSIGTVGDGVAPASQPDPLSGRTFIYYTAGTRVYRVIWDNAGPALFGTPYYLYVTGTLGTSSPVIDANGWTYVQASNGYVMAIYRYWYYAVFYKKLSTMGTLTGGITIGDDGMLYVPLRSNVIFALGAP